MARGRGRGRKCLIVLFRLFIFRHVFLFILAMWQCMRWWRRYLDRRTTRRRGRGRSLEIVLVFFLLIIVGLDRERRWGHRCTSRRRRRAPFDFRLLFHFLCQVLIISTVLVLILVVFILVQLVLVFILMLKPNFTGVSRIFLITDVR